MPAIIRNVVLTCGLVWSTFASANVITDWDVKAVAYASPGVVGQREVTLVHVAMIDAVNSIERRYRPYLVQLTAAKTTSQEAAAAMPFTRWRRQHSQSPRGGVSERSAAELRHIENLPPGMQ